jgi:pimeloyl-ACP methyl ester carboxylesterase
MPPETRYAKSGDVNIAYQVVGDGPFDLVYVPGWVSNIGLMWEEPAYGHLLRRLASFSRLILFDKRGTGLSDPVPVDRLPTLELGSEAGRARRRDRVHRAALGRRDGHLQSRPDCRRGVRSTSSVGARALTRPTGCSPRCC